MDGVDAAIASFDGSTINVLGTETFAYENSLKEELLRSLDERTKLSLDEFASLNVRVGICFAEAANRILQVSDSTKELVAAIGSHGQTLRHSPNTRPAYTLQIGDPATIAVRSGIPTVADFRSLDVAAGGQGAPLVPPFHAAYLRDGTCDTIVLNIGGIANITTIPADANLPIGGYDTGPGNCLLDDWIRRTRNATYDDRGDWARSGTVNTPLLKHLLADPYLKLAPPKSTGREHYNLRLIDDALSVFADDTFKASDIQSTLLQFSVATIAQGIRQSEMKSPRVLVCGGGVRNKELMNRLKLELSEVASLDSTSSAGIDADYVEALAFAWLARERVAERRVRLTSNAENQARLLGAVYLPSN